MVDFDQNCDIKWQHRECTLKAVAFGNFDCRIMRSLNLNVTTTKDEINRRSVDNTMNAPQCFVFRLTQY